MGNQGAMMGFLDEIFSGVSGVSGASYRDCVDRKSIKSNKIERGGDIYDECRDHAPLAPHPPLAAPVETDQSSNTEANSWEFTDATETRIQKITRATNPDELVRAMSDYIPGLLSDSELVALTRVYELKMTEFLPEEWPGTSPGQATPPGTPESGQRSQNPGHPERITHSLAWDGSQVIALPRCGVCEHFNPDSINPVSGIGDCEAFLLPDGKRTIGRFPMQDPKTATCFEKKEATR
ncbi:MAG: hypothetical protein ACYC9S_01790 [Leptospirales bacterium]